MQLPVPLAAALFTITLFLPSNGYAQDVDDAGENQPPRKINFTPDPRYTVFDGPLREDGTIDYVAALNGYFSEEVNTENNAFRGLFLILPHEDEKPEIVAGIQKALLIEPVDFADVPRLVHWRTYAEEAGLDEEKADAYVDSLLTGPYDGEGGRLIADWLASNREAIDRAVVEINKPRFWSPLVDWDDGKGLLVSIELSHLRNHRHLAQAMHGSVGLAIAEGDAERAIELLLAMRRLAWHQSHDAFKIGNLVGISIDAQALEALETFLKSRIADAAALKRLAAGWQRERPRRAFFAAVEVDELCIALDRMMHLAAGRITWDGLIEGVVGQTKEIDQRIQDEDFDLALAFKMIAQHYRLQARIQQAETAAGFIRAHELFDDNFDREKQAIKDRLVIEVGGVKVFNPQLSARELTELVTGMCIRVITPTMFAARNTEFRFAANEQCSITAIACERYRLIHGRYPEQIDALVPDFLDAVPIDPMDGKPLRYRIKEDGSAIIYTISTNLEDDGGINDPEDPDASMQGDYVWRLKLPK